MKDGQQTPDNNIKLGNETPQVISPGTDLSSYLQVNDVILKSPYSSMEELFSMWKKINKTRKGKEKQESYIR